MAEVTGLCVLISSSLILLLWKELIDLSQGHIPYSQLIELDHYLKVCTASKSQRRATGDCKIFNEWDADINDITELKPADLNQQ